MDRERCWINKAADGIADPNVDCRGRSLGEHRNLAGRILLEKSGDVLLKHAPIRLASRVGIPFKSLREHVSDAIN